MAGLTYPGIQYLRGYDGGIEDIFDAWNTGEAAGKSQRFEEQAPELIGKSLPSLTEYGLGASPDEINEMLRNPRSKDYAMSLIADARQRRDDALDPAKQMQLAKLKYDVAHQGDAPRNATSDSANARMKLGWEQGLRGKELQTYVLTGDLPKEAAAPNAPSGYRYTEAGDLSFIPGGPADPSLAALKPPTDADVRANKLSSVIQGDKELLLGSNGDEGIYNALTDLGSQIANTEVGVGGVSAGRPGYAFTSPDFQSASNALTNIAQSYLYAVSGQAAPAGEVAKIVESVTPKMGESEGSVKNKRARLQSYIDAIEVSKYDAPTADSGGGGIDDLVKKYAP